MMDELTTDRLVYATLAVLLVAEATWPARGETSSMPRRWCFHAALFVLALGIGTLGYRLMALVLSDTPIAPPRLWHVVVVVLALDLTAYATHVLAHRYKFLWRFHRLHHADETLDVSTTFRQHPVQQLWLMPCVVVVAAVCGANAWEVGLYVALQLCVQALAHANLWLPAAPMTALGWVFITPELHQAHHSPEPHEANSNYGEVFSFWDRIFGTRTPPMPNRQIFGLNPPTGTPG